MRRNVGLVAALACAVALAAWLVARETPERGAPVHAGSAEDARATVEPSAAAGDASALVELQRPVDPAPAPPRDVDPAAGATRAAPAGEAPGVRSFQQVPTMVEITALKSGQALRPAPDDASAFEERAAELGKAERAARLEALRAERATTTAEEALRALDAEIRWLEAHPGD